MVLPYMIQKRINPMFRNTTYRYSTVQPVYELLKRHHMNCFIHVISKDICIFTTVIFVMQRKNNTMRKPNAATKTHIFTQENLYDSQNIPCYLKKWIPKKIFCNYKKN